MQNSLFELILMLIVFACMSLCLSCGDDDDDDSRSGDDDDDNNDDDNDDSVPSAQVTDEGAPDGNLLARHLVVTTDTACSLSGFLTTASEYGYAPSDPTESENGTEHSFWFYGLLQDTEFDYTFYIAGEPEKVVATGTISVDELPEQQPAQTELTVDDTAAATDWFLIWGIDSLTWGGVDVNWTLIYDREGRIRFYHLNDFS